MLSGTSPGPTLIDRIKEMEKRIASLESHDRSGPVITLAEQTTAPSTPGAGVGRVYLKNYDGRSRLCVKYDVDDDMLARGEYVFAWVNFDGSNPVVIRDSCGVDSVTRNGNGDYTVNWQDERADANYCVLLSCNNAPVLISITTTGARVRTMYGASPATSTLVCVVAFGWPT